ncbi:hypothetical protein I6E52_07315 [Salinibacterium sp. NG253]|uniref:hypothetical protein n=1 Tax=Salinibacterium sp. NG253 TaxID=2792039 RepID=UPI0018CF0447|nr:hypothetical protein [Salinibacterium sp. NG253]MBH0116653.1 hypothetical protein [Salinibacterium sp. NG253]
MNTSRVVPALVVSSLLAIALAGCGPSGSSEPTESPVATATEAPTADPTPSETPVVLASECTELLDDATLASMAGSSFPLLNPEDTTSYVDKIRSEAGLYGPSAENALFVDNGGLLCLTSDGYAVGEVFGYSPITPAQAAVQQEALLDQGYSITGYLGGDLYSQLSPSDDVVSEYLFAGGYWFCAKTIERLDEIIANSGVPL